MRKTLSLSFAIAMAMLAQTPPAQAPRPAKTGPRLGEILPQFSAPDQNGRTQNLASVMGAKGAMLVFFRSADW